MSDKATMCAVEDLESIGQKIVEMADRVKVVHAVMPGAQAKWMFEMDGTLYRVVVKVEDRTPPLSAGDAE